MALLYNYPTNDNLQYSLNVQMGSGDNSCTLSSSVAGIVQAPGVFVIDRVDASGNKTPSVREYISFTGVSSNQLTGLSRGLAGSTGQNHNVGAIVEFVPDVVQAQAVNNVITQEHSSMGQHMSLASTVFISTQALVALSLASINQLSVGSTATIPNLSANVLNLPSAASGWVFTSLGGGASWASSAAGGGVGGLGALFQVPGGLASQANVGGLIPIPTNFTMSYLEAFVQTPASIASVSVLLKKNLNTVVGMVTILAGGTYGSSASLSNSALAATDNLTIDINSTASLAQDLSVLVKAS